MQRRNRMWLGVFTVLLGMALVGGAQEPGVPPEAAEEESVGAEAPQITLLQLLLKGGPVMYPLGFCSILMVAVALERGLALRRKRVLPEATVRAIRLATGNPAAALDAAALLRVLEPQEDALARVAAAGLRKSGRPVLEVEKAMEDAGAKEVARLQRNNRVLSSIAGVAPLLGLLGTTTGIIQTFITVAAHSEALGKPEVLAGGIYEALVATAVGLSVAIVALVFYYYFQERIDRLAMAIDDALTGMSDRLSAKV